MPGMSPAAWRSPVSGVACRAPRTSSGTAIGWPTAPARRAQLGAARFLAARLHRRAAVAFRPVPVARAGLVRRVARPAPGDGPRRLPALRQRPVPVAATTRLGAGRPRTALAAPEPGFLCRPGGGGRVAPAGAATRPSELLAGPWPGRLFLVLWAAAGLAALLLPGDWPLARGLLGVAGLACLAAAVAHLAPWLMRGRLPALGPDLTLILCGALLIRHAWMQARAAAPPAHPRVTGDHHA